MSYSITNMPSLFSFAHVSRYVNTVHHLVSFNILIGRLCILYKQLIDFHKEIELKMRELLKTEYLSSNMTRSVKQMYHKLRV